VVDWEHLDLALKNKMDMYKKWQSKQHSGFCGTRVQVGRYSGNLLPDERCPNCGRRETAAHLMLFPDNAHTRLLNNNVNELTAWLARDNNTDPEILYWIPKYILTRGDEPLSKMGFMSPQFKALATSQDLIGWRDFTEGQISTHFYAIQSFHLAMTSNYLNGEVWTKQFISKILQIMRSQWIFRNVSLHDRMHGYLHNQKADKILQQLNFLLDLASEEVPKASQFLLEINFSKLFKSNLKTQTYWTLVVDAALKAKALDSARGARAKRVRRKLSTKIPSRKKLGIATIEHQICKDGMHRAAVQTDIVQTTNCFQLSLDRFVQWQPHPAYILGSLRSNKRLRKPN
jgi:hypothetical protein